MRYWLKVGIVLTTLGWVVFGAWITAEFGQWTEVGLGGVIFGWTCAMVGQSGLLASPFAGLWSMRGRVMLLMTMLPGLTFLVANTVDALDGHKSPVRPLSLLTYASLVVWLSAGYYLMRPNKTQQPTGAPSGAGG